MLLPVLLNILIKCLGNGMKCCLSRLADDTRVGAVVDIFEGKGCLIQWNPDKLDIRNNKSQSSTWTHTKSFTCSRLILYQHQQVQKSNLTDFLYVRGIKKRLLRGTHQENMRQQTHCSKKSTSWTYERKKDESEQKLKVEQEQVYQKDCGRSFLGDEENLTDKALTNMTEF